MTAEWRNLSITWVLGLALFLAHAPAAQAQGAELLGFNPPNMADQTLSVGQAVNLALPVGTGGIPPYEYALQGFDDELLPAGLTFDASTNSPTITGTTSAADFAPLSYQVTDAAGTEARMGFFIHVLAPVLSHEVPSQQFVVRQPITPLELPRLGNFSGRPQFELTGTLPAGLGIEGAGRVSVSGPPYIWSGNGARIVGTPTQAQSPVRYVLTASGGGVTVSQAITMEVLPVGFAPASIDNQRWRLGQTVYLKLPTAISGAPPFEYILSGASLPAGLTFDGEASPPTISGLPTVTMTDTEFAYTVRDSGSPEAQRSLVFRMRVDGPVPLTFGSQVIDDQRWKVGSVVNLHLPTARGGVPPYSYSLTSDVNPAAPQGLTFDANADPPVITGEPSLRTNRTLTYTATDALGATVSLTFDVTVPNPRLSFVIPSQSYSVGVPISPLALPTFLDVVGNPTYSLEPELPAGLRLDGANPAVRDGRLVWSGEGVRIVGAPTEPQERASYTLSVSVGNQGTGFAFDMEISPLTFVPTDVEDQTWAVGDTVYLALPLASSGEGPYTYALENSSGVGLPAGLTFDASPTQPAISGTPTQTYALQEFRFVVTDSATQATAQLSFNIAVAGEPTLALNLNGPANVYEDAGDVAFVLTRSGVTNEEARVIVRASTTGAATQNLDYVAPRREFTFPANLTGARESRSYVVKVIDDGVFELEDEWFEIVLLDETGRPIGDNRVRVNIVTRNALTLDYGADNTYVNEDDRLVDEGVGEVALELTAEGAFTEPFSVLVRPSTGGPAIRGRDYMMSDALITLSPSSGGTHGYRITILDDNQNEADEWFEIVVVDSETNRQVADLRRRVTIADNDPIVPGLPTLKFVLSEMEVREDDLLFEVRVVLESESSRPGPDGASVQLVAVADTATETGDYTFATQTLEWSPGTSVIRVAQVALENDRVAENVEAFTLELRNPVRARLGSLVGEREMRVTIRDEDVPLVTASAPAAVPEGDAAVMATVTLSQSPGTDVTVGYATQDGTASAGDGDYTRVAGELTFTAGTTRLSREVAIPVNDDTDFEPDETFTFALTNVSGLASISEPGEVSVTIANNDFPLSLSSRTIVGQVWRLGEPVNVALPLATGGVAPLDYRLDDVAGLPSGVSFDDSTNPPTLRGVPSGTQPRKGFTYSVTDAADPPQTKSVAFHIAVELVPLSFEPPPVRDQRWRLGRAVSLALPTARGGVAPYTYQLSGDAALPTGLTFDAEANPPTVTGIATASLAGTEFAYSVMDSSNPPQTLTQRFDMAVTEVPLLELTLNGSPNVYEDVGEVAFTVTLRGVTQGETRLSVRPSSRTPISNQAVPGIDFVATPFEFSFPANPTGEPITRDYSVQIIDDGVMELVDEWFEIVLVDEAEQQVGDNRVRVNILTRDSLSDILTFEHSPNNVYLSEAARTVRESVGQVRFNLTVKGAFERPFSVTVVGSSAGSLASYGLDLSAGYRTYTFTQPGTVEYVADIFDDGFHEGDEWFQIVVTDSRTRARLPGLSLLTTIVDDDEIAFTSRNVAHQNWRLGQLVDLALPVINGAGPYAYTLEGEDGAALPAGVAFDASVNPPVILGRPIAPMPRMRFTYGAPGLASLSFYISVTEEVAFELTLAGPTDVSERVGDLTFTVTQTGMTSQETPLALRSSVNGTATEGADYLAPPYEFSFPANLTGATLSRDYVVRVIDDGLFETATEWFEIVLLSEVGAQVGDNRVRVNITTDNELTFDYSSDNVYLNASERLVAEDVGQVKFDLVTSGVSDVPLALQVRPSTGGMATLGVDYEAAVSAITLDANPTGERRTIEYVVNVLDDYLIESNEWFDVLVLDPLTSRELESTRLRVTIADNDTMFVNPLLVEDQQWVIGMQVNVQLPTVSGGNPPYTYELRGAGGTNLPAGLTFDGLTNPPTITGTATAPFAQTRFTYEVADSAPSPVTRELAFLVSVQETAAATLTLNGPAEVAEDVGEVTFTVTQRGVVLEPTEFVLRASSGGTASAGTDFVAPREEFTFPANPDGTALTREYVVQVIDDNVREINSEWFEIVLLHRSGGLVGDNRVRVTILPSDSPAVTFDYANDDAFVYRAADTRGVAESAGVVSFRLGVQGSLAEQLTLRVRPSVRGTATELVDYDVPSATYNFAPGEDVSDFRDYRLTIFDDDEIETGDEWFEIVVLDDDDQEVAGTRRRVTIVDDDHVHLVPPNLGDQTWVIGQSVDLELPTLFAAAPPFTYLLEGAGGALLPAGLNFDATSTPPTVTGVPTAEFARTEFTYAGEGAGTLLGTVAFDVAVYPAPTRSMALRMIDGTQAAMVESVGEMTFAVTLDDSPEIDMSVDYTVTSSASTGEDETDSAVVAQGYPAAGVVNYVNASGTLTFPAGATGDALTQRFNVTVVDDDADEANETFVVSLSNPYGATIVGADSITMTIMDDDMPSFAGDAPALGMARMGEPFSMALPGAVGAGPFEYELTPVLPVGLTFDATSLMIVGEPAEIVPSRTYTLIAINDVGERSSMNFEMQVAASPMTFAAQVEDQTYEAWVEITPVTLPEVSGGGGAITYSLAPALPEGMLFDAKTREVAGTPTRAQERVEYTLTATDESAAEVSLAFGITVTPGTDPILKPIAGFMQSRADALVANQPRLTRFLKSPSLEVADYGLRAAEGRRSLSGEFAGSGMWGEVSAVWQESNTLDTRQAFGAVGYHRHFSERMLGGLMLQFDDVASDLEGRQGDVQGTGWLAGPYLVASLATQPLYFEGRLLYGTTDNDIDLRMDIPGYRLLRRQGSFKTERLLAQFRVEGESRLDMGARMVPFLDLSHVRDDAGAFTDDTARRVPGQRVSLERFELGLEFDFPISMATGELALVPEVSYVLTDADGGDYGESTSESRGRIDLQLDYQRTDSLRLWLETFYEGLGGAELESYGVKVGVEARF